MQLPPNRIKELREKNGERRAHLAVLLGVVEATIQRYEEGKSAVPDETKLVLADHYDVSPAYLMGWDRKGAMAA